MSQVDKEAAEVVNLMVSDLDVNGLAKLFSMAVQEMQASNQTASQVTAATVAELVDKSVSTHVQKAVGQLQSDLASRTIVKSDIDVGMDERLRADGASQSGLNYMKMNAFDFSTMMDSVGSRRRMDSLADRMVEASVNHYATTLTDERVAKAQIGNISHATNSQGVRHAEIAVEKQWSTTQENAQDALVAKMVAAITGE